ncbi:esterase-like activity of phytase family protein [Sphingorhabdus arenilitoris]|uniref:Esterase-like activity of phytase family protein n=1 Tax=Sphingorhabdus arenilitoris TaxID=1490041 RepID=A0ABV8REV6_9SPHN
MAKIMLFRLLRSTLLIAMLICLIGGIRVVNRNDSQDIALRPLALDVNDSDRRTVGALTFLRAWELGSGNSDFGGISALVALPGGRFMGVSDAGALIGFGLTRDDKADRPFIAALPGAVGPNISYEDRDSEGIAYDRETGRFWVSYEAKHMIRRFTPSFARISGKFTAPEMKKWGANSGGEALVRLADGRFILFSEGMDLPDGSYQALFFSGDPVEAGTSHFSFGYRPPSGYKATDATLLPDGRILILTRRVSFPDGFTAKLVLLDPSDIAKEEAITGTVIATLAPPLLVDNMEGLTTTQENGRIIVWMISDNNFNAWQRTLLMKFILNLDGGKDRKGGKDEKKPDANIAPGFQSL